MKNTNTEISDASFYPPAQDFRHARSSLVYDDIRSLRDELTEFLLSYRISKTETENLAFVLSEILSNLIKHPVKKASHVEIRAAVSESLVDLEILDNSTPFLNFNEKCTTAFSRLNAAEAREEHGYGLGCILTLYKNPVYISAGKNNNFLNQFKISHRFRKTGSAPPLSEKKTKNKIFLIDDDPISIQIHRRMLMDDYDVISFEKAEDALLSFPELRPDLIISDINMCGMDGMTLRRELEKIENGNTTPFIFLSGNSDNEHNPYISQLGVDDFLCKPVSEKRLKTVLSRLLQRSKQICASVQGQFHHDITESLKPSMPENYSNWMFITKNIVADAGGGDFILHHETPENMTTVLVDVMGHGRQAKFFSYAYAGYLRGLFRMYTDSIDPSKFLKLLSQSIDGDPLLESMIMTCQCFQFFSDGLFKVASAGHPRPIIIRQAGAELVDVMGPLPGLIGDNSYDMKSIRLKSGDKILFMTDGFMEVFDRHGRAAQELLKRVDVAASSKTGTIEENLWQEFQMREKGQNNKDDATIIIAEYGGIHEHKHEYRQ